MKKTSLRMCQLILEYKNEKVTLITLLSGRTEFKSKEMVMDKPVSNAKFKKESSKIGKDNILGK